MVVICGYLPGIINERGYSDHAVAMSGAVVLACRMTLGATAGGGSQRGMLSMTADKAAAAYVAIRRIFRSNILSAFCAMTVVTFKRRRSSCWKNQH